MWKRMCVKHTKLRFKSKRFAGASFVYIILLFICLKETFIGFPIQQRSLSFINILFYLQVTIVDCGLWSANCYYLLQILSLHSAVGRSFVLITITEYSMFGQKNINMYLYNSSAWWRLCEKNFIEYVIDLDSLSTFVVVFIICIFDTKHTASSFSNLFKLTKKFPKFWQSIKKI